MVRFTQRPTRKVSKKRKPKSVQRIRYNRDWNPMIFRDRMEPYASAMGYVLRITIPATVSGFWVAIMAQAGGPFWMPVMILSLMTWGCAVVWLALQ